MKNNEKIYNEIQSCRLCFSCKIHDVLNLGFQPPANSLRAELKISIPTAPLKLMYCDDCSSVQLSATVDPNYLFNQYVWVTGTSSTARKYSEFFCSEVLNRVSTKSPFVVEIASNDGTFLKVFKENNCNVLGVDPAKNIANEAIKSGIPTITDFFNIDIAKKILKTRGKADIILARNVIPHVKDIHSILEGFCELVKDDGIVVIEFHYSKIIADELHYDSIYHEHLFYFSLLSLIKLFNKHNLYAFDVFSSPISGGSLVLFFKSKQAPLSKELKALIDVESLSKLNNLSTWKDFGAESKKHALNLKSTVEFYLTKGPLIGYGASARSSTLLNFVGISSSEIECIIDRNPIKHGLFTPGTNIPIVSYEEGLLRLKGKHLLLLAWNFEDEVVRDLRACGFKGDIIVPLPNKVHIR